jgi:hypothetical protein
MRHSSADSFVQSQKRRFWFHSSRSRRSAQPTTYRMHKTNTPSVISKVTSRQSPLPVTRDPLPVTQDVLAQPLFFPCPSRSNTATAFLLDSTPEHIIIKRVNKDIPVICLEDDSDETDVLRPEQLNSDLSAETETSDKKKHGRKKNSIQDERKLSCCSVETTSALKSSETRVSFSPASDMRISDYSQMSDDLVNTRSHGSASKSAPNSNGASNSGRVTEYRVPIESWKVPWIMEHVRPYNILGQVGKLSTQLQIQVRPQFQLEAVLMTIT